MGVQMCVCEKDNRHAAQQVTSDDIFVAPGSAFSSGAVKQRRPMHLHTEDDLGLVQVKVTPQPPSEPPKSKEQLLQDRMYKKNGKPFTQVYKYFCNALPKVKTSDQEELYVVDTQANLEKFVYSSRGQEEDFGMIVKFGSLDSSESRREAQAIARSVSNTDLDLMLKGEYFSRDLFYSYFQIIRSLNKIQVDCPLEINKFENIDQLPLWAFHYRRPSRIVVLDPPAFIDGEFQLGYMREPIKEQLLEHDGLIPICLQEKKLVFLVHLEAKKGKVTIFTDEIDVPETESEEEDKEQFEAFAIVHAISDYVLQLFEDLEIPGFDEEAMEGLQYQVKTLEREEDVLVYFTYIAERLALGEPITELNAEEESCEPRIKQIHFQRAKIVNTFLTFLK